MLIDHIKRINNVWGRSRKAKAYLDTVRMFSVGGLSALALNLMVIDRREARGVYYSPDAEWLTNLMQRHAVNGVDDFTVGSALADQNLFATATKCSLQAVGSRRNSCSLDLGGIACPTSGEATGIARQCNVPDDQGVTWAC